MIIDEFMAEFIRSRKERGLSVEEVSDMMGITAETIKLCEDDIVYPSIRFIRKAIELFDISADRYNLENVFTQGYFGNKIPLITEYDLVNDCCDRVIYHMELPHLGTYGDDNLFALRYQGDDIPEKGILNGSILIFAHCTSVDRNGIYAIVKRDKLTIKSAELNCGEIRLVPLDGKRRTPTFCKSSIARGRLVSCINNYD